MLKQKLKPILLTLLVSALFTLPTFAQSTNLNIENNESRCKEVRAIDTKGNSSAWSGCHNVTITSATPPATPETPTIPVLTGTRAATVGTAYVLSIYATDPQADQIKYEVSYDPAYGNWTSQLYNSGLTLNLSIPYNTAGSYCIKVRAIDAKANASAYSACHTVVVTAANTSSSATFNTIGAQVLGTTFPVTHIL